MPPKKGGNKNKKQKKTTVPDERPLEFKDIGQEYAIVQKALGNGRFNVLCTDTKPRLAHVRGALKKKKVFVKVNDVVIVGLRDFEDSKCDIIYVYLPKEVVKLKDHNEIPLEFIVDHEKETVDCGVDFVDPEDEKVNIDEINFDDI